MKGRNGALDGVLPVHRGVYRIKIPGLRDRGGKCNLIMTAIKGNTAGGKMGQPARIGATRTT